MNACLFILPWALLSPLASRSLSFPRSFSMAATKLASSLSLALVDVASGSFSKSVPLSVEVCGTLTFSSSSSSDDDDASEYSSFEVGSFDLCSSCVNDCACVIILSRRGWGSGDSGDIGSVFRISRHFKSASFSS